MALRSQSISPIVLKHRSAAWGPRWFGNIDLELAGFDNFETSIGSSGGSIVLKHGSADRDLQRFLKIDPEMLFCLFSLLGDPDESLQIDIKLQRCAGWAKSI